MEIWKDIKEFEGHYQVSDLGKVRSLDRITITKRGKRYYKGVLLKLSLSAGYYKVILTKGKKSKQVKVHVLVAMAFLDFIPKKELTINHKDNIRTNNSKTNFLE